MKPFLGGTSTVVPGTPLVVESDVPSGERGVVFEDDGNTGYFYARDSRVPETLFVDAMHVYSVKGVVEADVASTLRIIRSPDFSKLALVINDSPHAVFDFADRIGYCIDAFPEPAEDSGWQRKGWSPELRNWFYPANS